jgi:hypothetical protein
MVIAHPPISPTSCNAPPLLVARGPQTDPIRDSELQDGPQLIAMCISKTDRRLLSTDH